ncbi:MAG TPA: hypothetical protein VD763_12000, partial [Candidatus Saccharimonadales bacterium]|nr:hypothetical protein [Candidatus Saccharimonadales bacterium]
VPGIHFAGTIGQGAKGLMRHGIPSNSGAVHGARYNARILAQRIAAAHFGYVAPRPGVAAGDVVDLLARELAEAPELFHQRGYLARVLTMDPAAGLVDDGVQPLAHVLDSGRDDVIAATLEADGTGAIYPVVYVRRDGSLREHVLEPDPMLRYDGPAARRAIAAAARPLVPDIAPD